MLSSRLFTLIFLALTLSLSGIAQKSVQGFIVDAETNEPLIYCTVKVKGVYKACLTNEEGFFKLDWTGESDSLFVSYLSYEKVYVSASYFDDEEYLRLELQKNNISQVPIISDKDFLYKLVVKCRENELKQASFECKSYLHLETKQNEIPLEVVECFLNSEIKNQSATQFDLKSGKIGLSTPDNFYFVSLHTPEVLSDYNLFDDSRIQWINPLKLNLKKLKKNYDLSWVSAYPDCYEIKFKPKSKKQNLCTGTLKIHPDNYELLGVSLAIEGVYNCPFIPIFNTHEINSFFIQLDYDFDQEKQDHPLRQFQFKYLLKYQDEYSIKDMQTDGMLYHYDVGNTFIKPHIEIYQQYNLYDQITARPFKEEFWEVNQLMEMSQRQERNLDYFSKNGLLLNYNQLPNKYRVEFLQNKKITWKNHRLPLSLLFPKEEEPMRHRPFIPRESAVPLNSAYSWSGQIYLDIYQTENGYSHSSAALLNKDLMFFNPEPEPLSDAALNTFFDLIEWERRLLEIDIQSCDQEKSTMDDLFKAHQISLNNVLDQYLSAVQIGRAPLKTVEWAEFIYDRFGFNNLLMTPTRTDQPIHAYIPNQQRDKVKFYYNAGMALLNAEFYSAAYLYFEKAYLQDLRGYDIEKALFICLWEMGKKTEACEVLDPVDLDPKTDGYFIEKCRKY